MSDSRPMATRWWKLQTLVMSLTALVLIIAPRWVFTQVTGQQAPEPTSPEQIAVDMIRMTSVYPASMAAFGWLAGLRRSMYVQRWFALAFVGGFATVTAGVVWAILRTGEYATAAWGVAVAVGILALANLGVAVLPPRTTTEQPSPKAPPGSRATWLAQSLYWHIVAWLFVLAPDEVWGPQVVQSFRPLTDFSRDATMIIGCWSVGFGLFCLFAALPLREHAWRGFAWLITGFLVVYYPVFVGIWLSGRFELLALSALALNTVFLLLNIRIGRYYIS